jgi:hypothetical protein
MMHPDLRVRRRLLVLSYRRYLDADRAWALAEREARAWLPAKTPPPVALVGNPGSRVRRLYETRERALARLLLAREKLEQGRLRLDDRRARGIGGVQVFLLTR